MGLRGECAEELSYGVQWLLGGYGFEVENGAGGEDEAERSVGGWHRHGGWVVELKYYVEELG